MYYSDSMKLKKNANIKIILLSQNNNQVVSAYHI